jgi:hypothetical protein
MATASVAGGTMPGAFFNIWSANATSSGRAAFGTLVTGGGTERHAPKTRATPANKEKKEGFLGLFINFTPFDLSARNGRFVLEGRKWSGLLYPNAELLGVVRLHHVSEDRSAD